MKRPFASVTLAALEAELAAGGYRKFVARQVSEAVYRRNAKSFDEMTNVGAKLRADLSRRYALRTLAVVERRDAPDGSFKLVLQLADGQLIECAYLASGPRGSTGNSSPQEESRGGTACISSQVGCAMGCVFCASGQTGLVRNLEPFEMIEQVLLVRDRLIESEPRGKSSRGQRRGMPPGAQRLSNVTVMGIGEPLANLDNVLAALQVVNAPYGPNIGARKISISTCGLLRGIRRLADEKVQYHLAISLHAPDDELRRRLMPGAGRATIAELMAAARYYAQHTGRKVVFEYVLIGGVNDDLRQAEELAGLLRDFVRRPAGQGARSSAAAMVNLIPANAVEHCPGLEPPTAAQAGRFLAALRRAGVEVCLRRRKGAEVGAACGQLRARLSKGAGPAEGR